MKKVVFLLPCMRGGGAERVASLLANTFYEKGIDVHVLLTQSTSDSIIKYDLSDKVKLTLMAESMKSEMQIGGISSHIEQLLASLLCKPFELFHQPVPARFAKLSITSQHKREIRFLRGILKSDPELSVISFLQPTIPIALLAAKGLPNKIIISERSDPNRLMKKRYGRKFIEKYYLRANAAVFQTEYAKNAYPKCISEKGVVIPNPIKSELPEPYHGERNNNITTFCRISRVKNLPVLVDAFAELHKEHGEYMLRIIGDAKDSEGAEVMSVLKELITGHGIADAVEFEPFNENVHEAIIKDAMYVNSSDYEGISNAMLEAMAIGMPVVCTDCPIGGARATINDGNNGLLVPVGDADALYRAMKRIAEDGELSRTLSQNAAKIRDELSLERISDEWIKLL